MELPKGEVRRLTLSSLPVDVLRALVPLISSYDLYALWATGQLVIRALLGPYGAVQRIKLDLSSLSIVRVPFEFCGAFSRLQDLEIMTGISKNPLLRSSSRSTDLATLPNGLTRLSLQAPNVLELLYDRSKLSSVVDPRPHDGYLRPNASTFGALGGYQLKPQKDCLRIFYDLNELFPNLSALILRETPISTIQEDEESLYASNLYLPSGLSRSELGFLVPEPCPSISPSEPLVGLESPKEPNWHYAELLKSLPKNLSSLTAIFGRPWDVETIAEHLPPTVTDLYVRSLLSRPKSTWSTVADDQDEFKELPISRLPSTLRHLTLHHWNNLSLESLPESLETLVNGALDLNLRQGSTYSRRFNLKVSKTLLPLEKQLSLLPMQLTSLTKLHCFWPTPFCILLPAEARSVWPSGLTSLCITAAPSDGELLLSSISHLPLEYLCLCYSTDEPYGHRWNLTPQLVQNLPRSLTTLECSNLGIQRPAWANMPPGITRMAYALHKDGFSGMIPPLLEPADVPPNVTDLLLSLPSRTVPLYSYASLPNIRRLNFQILMPGPMSKNAPAGLTTGQFGCLTELTVVTSQHLDRAFCSLLPRSLKRLTVDHALLTLGSVDKLPEGLEYLATEGAILPLVKLPPNLTHLQFSYPSPSSSRKRAIGTPEEIARKLPRSLTYLHIKRCYGWDASLAPLVPKSLRLCIIEGPEVTLRFRSLQPIEGPEEAGTKPEITPASVTKPEITPTRVTVEPKSFAFDWLLLLWGWLMSFFYSSRSTTLKTPSPFHEPENTPNDPTPM